MTFRTFPVLYASQVRMPGAPEAVPWALVAAHEAQALINHGQTIEKLASRGGLSVFELLCVLTDTHWSGHPLEGDDAAALPELRAIIAKAGA